MISRPAKRLYNRVAVLEIPVVNTYDDYFWADELVVSSINSPGSAGKPTTASPGFQARDRETVDAFTRRRWHTAAVITAHPVSELITQGTTRPLYAIPMVTISKRFTMAGDGAASVEIGFSL